MNDRLRISDDDRERAAATLGEHFAEGRLTNDEHAERLDAIWSARTASDLAPMFADLPRRQPTPWQYAAPLRPAPRFSPEHLTVVLLPMIVALVVLSVVVQRPFWILAVVLAWVAFRLRTRRRRRERGRGHPGPLPGPTPWQQR